MMKLLGSLAILFALTVGLTAQSLDTGLPVAIIKMNKVTSIVTQKEFRDQEAAAENALHRPSLDKKAQQDLIQDIIGNHLLKMDMDAKGIKATDDDVYKELRSRNRNQNVTDQQIRQAVESQSGQKWDVATADMKLQLAKQKYLGQFPEFRDLGNITVDAKEIQDFYDSNTDKFAAPDYIRISHIFFDTKSKPNGTLAEIQKRATETLRKITSGESTFEEQASTVSDDNMSSKINGDLGYFPKSIDNPKAQQFVTIVGKDFYDQLFKLKKGEVSQVLTSNVGLHIVRVTQKGDKLDHHFLGIDEPVAPGEQTTVRQYIQQYLQNVKLQQGQQKVVAGIAADLKKKADSIQIFEQNF